MKETYAPLLNSSRRQGHRQGDTRRALGSSCLGSHVRIYGIAGPLVRRFDNSRMGLHYFVARDSGTLSPFTQSLIVSGRLSINPLELLVSAAVFILLGRVGSWPGNT